MQAALEDQRRIAIQFIEAIAGGEIERSHLAEGWFCWNASLGQIDGETYLTAIRNTQLVLPELEMKVEYTVAERNRVVVMATSSAPLEAGGRYENRYAFIFSYIEGRVSRIDALFDTEKANDVLLPLIKARTGQTD